MIQYLYLGRMDYDNALCLQDQLVEAHRAGRIGNTFLLLEHPPVLTLGRNANRSNILASDELLATRGVTVHQINRGGDVTYHGPGQLVGYPIFDLRSLRNPSGNRMGPVDFVRQMEEALIRLTVSFGVPAGRIPTLTGVWCPGLADGRLLDESTASTNSRKIAAIGIHVSRGITSHGFAYNLNPNLADFTLINPCGITDKPVTSLQNELRLREPATPPTLPSLEAIAHQAARHFGLVFDQQILAVETLSDLLPISDQHPAEDTPLAVPAELQRLSHAPQPPIRA